jgi:arylsulfatase A-like enzyme
MKRISLLPLVFLAALFLTSCGGPDGPSVVLVTIDTQRSDHLSAYGYERPTSPYIAELSEQGVLFETAYSQTNSTNPSHTTIMTGRYVKTHGVSDNTLGFARTDLPTLAERFRDSGYATVAVVSTGHLNQAHSGLGRGFEQFINVQPRPDTPEGAFPDWTRPASEAIDIALRWLQSNGDKPYFLWIHLFDPHMPYIPEPPYEKVLGTGRAGRVATMGRVFDRSLSLEELFRQQPNLTPMEKRLYEATYRREIPIEAMIYDGVGWTEEEVASFRALYDAEILQTDAALGRLFAALRAGEAGQEPVVALTADHGEVFGKGGVFFDHRGIYSPSIRVPLIFWHPGDLLGGQRRPEVVQGIDVAPTLLELAGIEGGGELPGRSLVSLLRGTGELAPMPIFVEHANGSAVAMIEGRWKLIVSLFEGRDDVDPLVYRHAAEELYDLAVDPAEEHDLSKVDPERVARMRGAILSWLAVDRGSGGNAELSPAMRKQLQALGYID